MSGPIGDIVVRVASLAPVRAEAGIVCGLAGQTPVRALANSGSCTCCRFPPRESGCPTIKLCVVASQAPVKALIDGRVVIEAMSPPRVSPPRMSMLKAYHPEVFVDRRSVIAIRQPQKASTGARSSLLREEQGLYSREEKVHRDSELPDLGKSVARPQRWSFLLRLGQSVVVCSESYAGAEEGKMRVGGNAVGLYGRVSR